MKRVHDACFLEQRAQVFLDLNGWLRRHTVRPLVKEVTANRKNAKGFNQDVLPFRRQVQQTRNQHSVERSVAEWQRHTRGRNGGDALGRSLATQDMEHFF